MPSLNLLQSSNLTFSKSNSSKYPINAPLLRSSFVNMSKNYRNIPSSSITLRNPSSELPNSQIFKSRPNFGKHLGYPFVFSSIFSSHELRATPQDSSSDVEMEASKPNKKFNLAVVYALWYFQNIVFNVYNTKLLNIFPYPWFLASFQLFCGSICMFLLWSLKLQPCPNIDKSFIVALLVPALFHSIAHISAYVSFSKVDAFSSNHVINSTQPFLSVMFSSFLGDSYPVKVWLSILTIVFGCSLSKVYSFSFKCLWGAVISNIGFVLRNIYSKKILQTFKEVNGLNLYGCISVISFLYLFPVAALLEASHLVSGYHIAAATIPKPSRFFYALLMIREPPSVYFFLNIWMMLSGIFYHLYNQSSYEALDYISPLTFSVVDTMMKRVVVIMAGVLVFKNPIKPLNAVGCAVAIFGTFLYSLATVRKSKIERGEEEGL